MFKDVAVILFFYFKFCAQQLTFKNLFCNGKFIEIFELQPRHERRNF